MADVAAVPKSLREKLGDDGSNDLVEFLNIFMDQKRQEITKEEFHEREKLELRFEKGLGETESRLTKKMDNGHSELKIDIEKVNVHVEKSKAEIIKWMFIFWSGTVITILGGLLGFLNLFFGK